MWLRTSTTFPQLLGWACFENAQEADRRQVRSTMPLPAAPTPTYQYTIQIVLPFTCMVTGKVANPVRGQLYKETYFFLCFCLRPFLSNWSRETGSAVSSRVSSLILQIQAESSIWCLLTVPPAFRGGVIVHLFIPSTAIGPVPSLSGHAILHRWHLLPRVLVLKVFRVTGDAFSEYTALLHIELATL